MDFRTILYEKLGAILRITTNRPHVLNAQSRVMLLELDEAFRRAMDDDDVRTVIVAGAGEHFSAGHDIGSPEESRTSRRTRSAPACPRTSSGCPSSTSRRRSAGGTCPSRPSPRFRATASWVG
ncbi:MAG: enoyl-CoA hydratase-related protein [Pseudomonadota bacterium]